MSYDPLREEETKDTNGKSDSRIRHHFGSIRGVETRNRLTEVVLSVVALVLCLGYLVSVFRLIYLLWKLG